MKYSNFLIVIGISIMAAVLVTEIETHLKTPAPTTRVDHALKALKAVKEGFCFVHANNPACWL